MTFDEVLGLADDALVAAQRLAQWCARAPELEEDVALAARVYAKARAEGVGRDLEGW